MRKLSFVILLASFAFGLAKSAEEPTANVNEESERMAPGPSAAQAQAQSQAQSRSRGSPSAPFTLHQCYVCTDCPHVTSSTVQMISPPSYDPTKNNRCVVYSEKYNHMKNSVVVRGSAAERGTCREIELAHQQHSGFVTLHFCHECVGDLCNSSGHHSISLGMALSTLVISSIFAKHILS